MLTLEQLDGLRGYLIAGVLLSCVIVGLCPKGTSTAARLSRIIAQIVGGIAGLSLFGMLSFIAGWDEYFAAKAAGAPSFEYHGPHVAAARLIQTLGEMHASALGIVFGLLGLVLLCAAFLEWFHKR
ncbi:MAG: hypothetical protein FWG75_07505 [Cystobacterineae bacterium]|nr:hypothetical protein [Cystobacterineae bacterium]